MDAAVIVIEVAPPAPAAEHLSALVQACNRASERAACVLAEHAPGDPPLAVAIVRGEGAQVRVELGMRRGTESEWHTRRFDFQPDDEELERWRAVGFAIGTLAQAAREAPPAETPAEPPSATPSAEFEPAEPLEPAPKADAPPPRRDRSTSSEAWLDGAFGAGPALDSGVWQLGGTVRSGIELVPLGPFFTASTFFATSVGDSASRLHVQWLGFAAGAGYPLLRSERGDQLEIRVEALFARLAASVEDELGRSDAGDRWLFGARAGLDVVLPLAGWLGFVACGDLTAMAPTDIRIAGRLVASAPALGYGVGAGLRLSLR